MRKKDADFWHPTNPHFTVRVAEFDNYSFAEQIGYKRFLDTLAPDLVHFCMPQQPILYRGKTVTTIHDLTLLNTYNSDKNWLMYHAKQLVGRFVFRRVARKSSVVFTPTFFGKDELVSYTKIDPSKVIVTNEAAEQIDSPLTPYDHPFQRFIMYVGQQPDYKNIRRLGAAHQQLLEKYRDLGLILVGKKAADTKANEAYFQQKNYKNILFTDFIPDSQKDWLLERAEAYVFPSLMEGWGLPPLEAMVAGTPVISSNASCMPEVLGDAAEYFDPLDTGDIVRVIDRVLDNKQLQTTMVQRGHKQVAKYSWRRMAEQTHAAYLQVLGLSTNSSEQ